MTGIGLGASFLLGIGFGIAGVLLVVALAAAAWIFGKSGPALAGLAVLLSLLGVWRSPDRATPVVVTDTDPKVSLTGTIDSHPATMRTGQQFTLTVDDNAATGKVRYCVLSTNTQALGKGARLRATGSVNALNDLPAQTRAALKSRSCDASFETSSVAVFQKPSRTQSMLNHIRNRIATVFQRVAPGDTGALMTGLVTGDDSALSQEAQRAFLATGTTHITAVSGTNFAMLIAVAAAVARGTGERRQLRWIASITAVIWFYAILVGLPPSAMRAALMATLALVALRIGRRPDFVTLLVICGAIQLAIRPGDLYSLSFQLSFAATLALVLVFSGKALDTRRLPSGVVMTAVAAHLATLPILAYRVGEVSFATVPANVAISPLVMVAFPLAALAGAIGILSESVAVVLAVPASILTSFILSFVEHAFAVLPGSIPLGATTVESMVILALVCWGIVLVMSHDARTAFFRASDWLTLQPARARLAFSVSAAMVLLTAGVVMTVR